MPQQAEAAVVLTATPFQFQNILQRLVVLQIHVPLAEHGALHHDQRIFHEVERLVLLHVEDGEGVACSATEARVVGVREGGVVVQLGLRVVAPRGGDVPSEVVLPSAPCFLLNPQFSGRLFQRAHLAPRRIGVAVGGVVFMRRG